MMRSVTTSRLAAFVGAEERRETAEVWAASVLAGVGCDVATDLVVADFEVEDFDDRFDV
jgi:hypothetical protein